MYVHISYKGLQDPRIFKRMCWIVCCSTTLWCLCCRSSFKSEVNKSSIGIVGLDSGRDIILRPGQTDNITVKAAVDGSYTAADIYEIYRLDKVGARVTATPTKFSNGQLVEQLEVLYRVVACRVDGWSWEHEVLWRSLNVHDEQNIIIVVFLFRLNVYRVWCWRFGLVTENLLHGLSYSRLARLLNIFRHGLTIKSIIVILIMSTVETSPWRFMECLTLD